MSELAKIIGLILTVIARPFERKKRVVLVGKWPMLGGGFSVVRVLEPTQVSGAIGIVRHCGDDVVLYEDGSTSIGKNNEWFPHSGFNRQELQFHSIRPKVETVRERIKLPQDK
ncbi:hypothetical protein [Zavarzinella formosa]|uniref:hypothetical protein n=1 Tax=Zavarzinella formosa TaxID=360055 RepID=UPI0003001768|nr:hypothetical protein [Zavarzinella formosa]